MQSEHFWNNVKEVSIILATVALFSLIMMWVLPKVMFLISLP